MTPKFKSLTTAYLIRIKYPLIGVSLLSTSFTGYIATTSVVTVSLYSRSVGVSLKKSVVGVGVFFKALCTANAATNAVPGTALMLGLASSLPPRTRSLEEREGMGGGTTDTASEYGQRRAGAVSRV